MDRFGSSSLVSAAGNIPGQFQPPRLVGDAGVPFRGRSLRQLHPGSGSGSNDQHVSNQVSNQQLLVSLTQSMQQISTALGGLSQAHVPDPVVVVENLASSHKAINDDFAVLPDKLREAALEDLNLVKKAMAKVLATNAEIKLRADKPKQLHATAQKIAKQTYQVSKEELANTGVIRALDGSVLSEGMDIAASFDALRKKHSKEYQEFVDAATAHSRAVYRTIASKAAFDAALTKSAEKFFISTNMVYSQPDRMAYGGALSKWGNLHYQKAHCKSEYNQSTSDKRKAKYATARAEAEAKERLLSNEERNLAMILEAAKMFAPDLKVSNHDEPEVANPLAPAPPRFSIDKASHLGRQIESQPTIAKHFGIEVVDRAAGASSNRKGSKSHTHQKSHNSAKSKSRDSSRSSHGSRSSGNYRASSGSARNRSSSSKSSNSSHGKGKGKGKSKGKGKHSRGKGSRGRSATPAPKQRNSAARSKSPAKENQKKQVFRQVNFKRPKR